MIPTNTATLISLACLAPPPTRALPIAAHHLSTYPLRDYQRDIILEVARLMAAGHRRILVVLPTGGGKTVLAAAMLRSASRLGQWSQFVVHRKELIDQTSSAFTRSAIPHGFVASGRPMDLSAAVLLAGVQTLVNRLDDLLPSDLTVVDEAHHATAASWDRVLSHAGDGFVVGLTATPERLDGRGLRDHFDVMVIGPSPAELIAAGYLSQFDYYAPDIPDLTDVQTTAGDFNRGQVGVAMDRPKLIGDMVEHYQQHAAGQQGIVFAASREHSRNLVTAYRAAGIEAAHVDGSMSDRDRTAAVDRFREGRIQVLGNVDLFGEGFDVPNVVYVGLARPTKSLALHRQQCGRALRVLPGKERAVICDHAGNALRLGDLPDSEREWSLEGRIKRLRGAGAPTDAESVRQCLTCYRVSYSTVAVCPGCGEGFPTQARTLREEEGRLRKLEQEELRRQAARDRKAEEKACTSYADYKALAEARGYADPSMFARNRMKMRRGSWRF